MSHRLAEGGVEPGDVVILLGRHSIEAAVAMLGCLHRGVVLAPLPPMFNETQLAALVEQTQATAIVTFGGEKEIAKCREVAGDRVPCCSRSCPRTSTRSPRRTCRPTATPRDADDLALVLHSSGTTSAPKGIAHSSNTLRYATEGVCRRWGLTGDDIYLTVVEFGFVGGLVFGYLPVLLNGATGVLLSRWKPEDALRLIEEHRCTYVLAMPTHAADMIRAAERDRPRPLLHARARRPGPDAGAPRWPCSDAFGVPPLGDYGLSEVPGHAAHAPDDPEEKILRTEGRPYDGTEIRIVGDDGQPLPAGEVGAVIVNGPSRFLGFFNNDDLTRESLTEWGGYRTGDLGVARRGRPLRLRRAQQGHHPPRRRHDRAGGGRAGHPAPPGRARGGDRAAARRPAGRARLRGDHRQARATPPRRSPSCRSSSTPRAWPSTRGRSPSRCSRTSRARRR